MVYNRQLTDYEVKIIGKKASWSSVANKEPEQLTAELDLLNKYYTSVLDPEVKSEARKLQIIRTELADSVNKIRELMVMQDSPQPKRPSCSTGEL